MRIHENIGLVLVGMFRSFLRHETFHCFFLIALENMDRPVRDLLGLRPN